MQTGVQGRLGGKGRGTVRLWRELGAKLRVGGSGRVRAQARRRRRSCAVHEGWGLGRRHSIHRGVKVRVGVRVWWLGGLGLGIG